MNPLNLRVTSWFLEIRGSTLRGVEKREILLGCCEDRRNSCLGVPFDLTPAPLKYSSGSEKDEACRTLLRKCLLQHGDIRQLGLSVLLLCHSKYSIAVFPVILHQASLMSSDEDSITVAMCFHQFGSPRISEISRVIVLIGFDIYVCLWGTFKNIERYLLSRKNAIIVVDSRRND